MMQHAFATSARNFSSFASKNIKCLWKLKPSNIIIIIFSLSNIIMLILANKPNEQQQSQKHNLWCYMNEYKLLLPKNWWWRCQYCWCCCCCWAAQCELNPINCNTNQTTHRHRAQHEKLLAFSPASKVKLRCKAVQCIVCNLSIFFFCCQRQWMMQKSCSSHNIINDVDFFATNFQTKTKIFHFVLWKFNIRHNANNRLSMDKCWRISKYWRYFLLFAMVKNNFKCCHLRGILLNPAFSLIKKEKFC